MSQQMKTAVLTIALFCGVICLPHNGMAQNAKIAVVDTEAVTFMSDEGKAANEKIEKRVQAMTAEMDKLRKDFEDKENNLRTRDRLMSAAAKAQLQKEIDDDKIKFERKSQDYQKEIDELQNTLMSPIADKIKAELATFVNDKGFDLLIDLSVQPGNVIWANPGNDITKELTALVNATFKKAGGAAAATPATTRPAATPTTTPAPSKPAAATPTPAASGQTPAAAPAR
jgi:Skp family chaperone for outer membrane proteins